MAFCPNRREGCIWNGSEDELENHLNTENLTTDNWLEGCEHAIVKCIFCLGEEKRRHQYTSGLKTVITVDDLNDVLNTAWFARDEWYNIGLSLGLRFDILEVIRMMERKSEDCLRRVLLEWLKTAGEKNWEMLREAMRDFKVGRVGVAEDVLISATCQSGKKILQEKYTKEADSKKEKVKQLTQKADRLRQEYKIKREEISYKEAELSGWQNQLIEHENEYEEIIRKRGHRESQSILEQVAKCETKIQECRELIKNLKDDISRIKEELKAVVDTIISCEIQLKITLNELSQCQEMLKVNKESMDDERKRRLNNTTAQKVRTAALTTSAVSGWGVAALSAAAVLGPFAPAVALIAGPAAAVVCVTSLTTAVVAEGVSWLTEDQKVINDEYMTVSSRCERTLEDATKVAQEAHTQLEELCTIAKEFKQLELLNDEREGNSPSVPLSKKFHVRWTENLKYFIERKEKREGGRDMQRREKGRERVGSPIDS